jgi:hypothetical protein
MDRSLPFADLKAHSPINERAMAANGAPDFSQKIRGDEITWSADSVMSDER